MGSIQTVENLLLTMRKDGEIRHVEHSRVVILTTYHFHVICMGCSASDDDSYVSYITIISLYIKNYCV
jgi:hypothetical protein